MPTSVALAAIGAAISGTTIAAGVITWGFSMSAFVSSLVLSGLSAALRPDAPSQQDNLGGAASAGRTVTTRQAITPWRAIYGRTRVGGTVTYKKTTSSNLYYHQVITFAGHVSEEIEAIYFNDDLVELDESGNATGTYAGYARILKSLGDEAGQPFPDLVTESEGEWTDAHRQTGRTKIYVRLRADNDIFPAGLPNITAVIKGKNDIYDPRDESTGYSANVALCLANYLSDTTLGVGALYANEIDETDLIAAANICDESVTLADATSEARYTCNGSFTAADKPVDIIPKLASAMAGYAVKLGGRWSILAGAYETPTIELTETDLAGALQWQSLISRRDSCNAVKGVYADPGNLWQASDFPAIVSATYVAEDNNETVYHDLQLDFTDSGTMAQRIAKIDLLRTRQGLTVSFPGKLGCFRARPGKVVMLTIEKYGWDQKPFWISDGKFSINADGTLGYHLSLRETAAAVYDWATSEEQTVDLAPNTTLIDPLVVTAPVVPTLASGADEIVRGGDGTLVSRIRVTLDASADPFVRWVNIRYKKSADADWIPTAPIAAEVLDTWLSPVEDGVDYDVAVRYENRLGVRSDWTQADPHTVVGKSAAPGAMPWAALSGDVLRWGGTGEQDLDGAVWRWQPGTNTSWGDANPLHDGRVQSPYTLANKPLNAVTLLGKWVDVVGNESTTAVAIVTDFGDPVLSNVIETVDCHAEHFTGTRTGSTGTGNVITTTTYDSVTLNGVAGTYVSTPDSVVNSVTGDASFVVDVALTAYSGLTNDLISKDTTGATELCYLLRNNPDGTLLFYWSENGTTLKSAQSTATLSSKVSANQRCMFGAHIDVDNGASGRTIRFYYSLDSGSTWTQLGSSVTQAGATSIYNGVSTVSVGRSAYAGTACSGKIYRGLIYSGDSFSETGTLAVSFDASRYNGGTTLTGSTGETWTLQGSAHIDPNPAGIFVDGAAQTGSTLSAGGMEPGETVLTSADTIVVDAYTYTVQADVIPDIFGKAAITLDRALETTPADQAAITIGTVTDLLAAAEDSPAAWTNDAAAAWTAPSDPAWDTVTYRAMTYTDTIDAVADAGVQLTVTHDITAGSLAIDYRRDGAADAWTDDLDAAWTDDAAAAWDSEDWQTWPGAITTEAVGYEFRVSTSAGTVRGQIAALQLQLDVPDIEETLADVALDAAGTRLAITKTYRAIKSVHLTLQADGGTARTLEVIDKNATLGPLCQGFDSTHTGADATADARIQGY